MLFSGLKKEEGFWSALFILFLVILAYLGMSTYYAVRTEGVNVADQINTLQADYTATSGVYYGIQRVQSDSLGEGESETVTIGNVDVGLSVERITGNPDFLRLTVNAEVKETSRRIEIDLSIPRNLADQAIWAKNGIDSRVVVQDSSGAIDTTLTAVGEEAPEMDLVALKNMAQVRTDDPTFYPPDGYPSGGCSDDPFYQADCVTPNVIWVEHDLELGGSKEISGIYIIEGNVVLSGTPSIHGVIYQPNEGSTLLNGTGNEPKVDGGIVTNGWVDGHGHPQVRHNPEYMEIFAGYQNDPDANTNRVQTWRYISSQ